MDKIKRNHTTWISVGIVAFLGYGSYLIPSCSDEIRIVILSITSGMILIIYVLNLYAEYKLTISQQILEKLTMEQEFTEKEFARKKEWEELSIQWGKQQIENSLYKSEREQEIKHKYDKNN